MHENLRLREEKRIKVYLWSEDNWASEGDRWTDRSESVSLSLSGLWEDRPEEVEELEEEEEPDKDDAVKGLFVSAFELQTLEFSFRLERPEKARCKRVRFEETAGRVTVDSLDSFTVELNWESRLKKRFFCSRESLQGS